MGTKSDLGQIYKEARELFLRGKYERALDRFKSIYEVDIFFRDVALIVDDYYTIAKDDWVAKYKTRFQERQGTA